MPTGIKGLIQCAILVTFRLNTFSDGWNSTGKGIESIRYFHPRGLDPKSQLSVKLFAATVCENLLNAELSGWGFLIGSHQWLLQAVAGVWALIFSFSLFFWACLFLTGQNISENMQFHGKTVVKTVGKKCKRWVNGFCIIFKT